MQINRKIPNVKLPTTQFDDSSIISEDDVIDINNSSDNADNNVDNNADNNATVPNNIANSIFAYSGKNFSYIQVNDDFYFKGKDIAEFLEYTNTMEAIREHVSDDNKLKLEDIFKQSKTLSLKGNQKNTIYITESGLYELILTSKKKEAKQFKRFVTNELLPKLRKTGSYNMNSKVIPDTSFISCFYDENDIHEYLDCNVVYLGVIGLYDGGYLFKYGKSTRIYDRDYKEHKTTYGDQFKLVLIINTDNGDKVEKIFEQTIKSKGLHRKITFYGKMREELFVTNEVFTAEKAKNLMIEIAKGNPTKDNKLKDEKIKELENNNEKEILIEKRKIAEIELKKEEEITKQAIELTKQLELKLKLKEKEKENGAKVNNKYYIKKRNNIDNNIDNIIDENCVYLKFLNECTECGEKHLSNVSLYNEFKKWYKKIIPMTLYQIAVIF